MDNSHFDILKPCISNSTPYSPIPEILEEILEARKLKSITSSEADQLMDKISESIEHGLTLNNDDLKLILELIQSLIFLQSKVANNELTMHKLKKLLGLIKKSEKESGGPPPPPPDDEEKDQETNQGNDQESNTSSDSQSAKDSGGNSGSNKEDDGQTKGHGKRGHADFEDAKVISHGLDGLSKGDTCPDCGKGKLYKYEPSIFVRITGHTPYEAEKHILERLRCNSCNKYFTAELPEEHKIDGEARQRFGWSAIALMAVFKFLTSNPYYRSSNLQDILGLKIAPSTIFDQVEKLSNAGAAIHKHLSLIAANSDLFFIDDTTNRILKKEKKKSKRTGKEKSAVYTSVMVAKGTNTKPIVLYKTSVGHAGDFSEEIFQKRGNEAGIPNIMSDALSHNT